MTVSSHNSVLKVSWLDSNLKKCLSTVVRHEGYPRMRVNLSGSGPGKHWPPACETGQVWAGVAVWHAMVASASETPLLRAPSMMLGTLPCLVWWQVPVVGTVIWAANGHLHQWPRRWAAQCISIVCGPAEGVINVPADSLSDGRADRQTPRPLTVVRKSLKTEHACCSEELPKTRVTAFCGDHCLTGPHCTWPSRAVVGVGWQRLFRGAVSFWLSQTSELGPATERNPWEPCGTSRFVSVVEWSIQFPSKE